MTELQGPVHLVGIGGVHMSAIGPLLMERGVAGSGSDLRLSALTERLAGMGATISGGHAAMRARRALVLQARGVGWNKGARDVHGD